MCFGENQFSMFFLPCGHTFKQASKQANNSWLLDSSLRERELIKNNLKIFWKTIVYYRKGGITVLAVIVSSSSLSLCRAVLLIAFHYVLFRLVLARSQTLSIFLL